ncbi:hypothetical protein CEE87_12850, partial [Lactobacillus crispatus]
ACENASSVIALPLRQHGMGMRMPSSSGRLCGPCAERARRVLDQFKLVELRAGATWTRWPLSCHPFPDYTAPLEPAQLAGHRE